MDVTARRAEHEDRTCLSGDICNDARMVARRRDEEGAQLMRLSGKTGRPRGAADPEPEGRDIDRDVFAAATRGDRCAFVELLRHYDRILRAVAFRLLDDRDEMDDVMQEVALKLYRALPTLRSEAALGTWLYRAAYSTCIDRLRKRRPVDLYAPDDMPEPGTIGTGGADPADVVVAECAVAALLAALTPEQRVIVTLVDQADFDYAHVSEIVGVPVGTVASRLHAARAVLRQTLADRDPGGGAHGSAHGEYAKGAAHADRAPPTSSPAPSKPSTAS